MLHSLVRSLQQRYVSRKAHRNRLNAARKQLWIESLESRRVLASTFELHLPDPAALDNHNASAIVTYSLKGDDSDVRPLNEAFSCQADRSEQGHESHDVRLDDSRKKAESEKDIVNSSHDAKTEDLHARNEFEHTFDDVGSDNSHRENERENESENERENESENESENERENEPENERENEPENEHENEPENEHENEPENESENARTHGQVTETDDLSQHNEPEHTSHDLASDDSQREKEHEKEETEREKEEANNDDHVGTRGQATKIDDSSQHKERENASHDVASDDSHKEPEHEKETVSKNDAVEDERRVTNHDSTVQKGHSNALNQRMKRHSDREQLITRRNRSR